MDLKAIDLSMLQRITLDELVCGEKGFRVPAQARIRRKRAMLRYP